MLNSIGLKNECELCLVQAGLHITFGAGKKIIQESPGCFGGACACGRRPYMFQGPLVVL